MGSSIGFIVTVFTFYIFIFIMLGMVSDATGDTTYTAGSISTSGVTTSNSTCTDTGLDQLVCYVGKIFDLGVSILTVIWQGFLFSITGLPTVFSILLFMPLSIGIIYAIISVILPGGS